MQRTHFTAGNYNCVCDKQSSSELNNNNYYYPCVLSHTPSLYNMFYVYVYMFVSSPGKTRFELNMNETVLPAAGSRWPPACTSRRTDPCSRAWGTAWEPRGVGRKRSPRWGPARFRVLLHNYRSKRQEAHRAACMLRCVDAFGWLPVIPDLLRWIVQTEAS